MSLFNKNPATPWKSRNTFAQKKLGSILKIDERNQHKFHMSTGFAGFFGTSTTPQFFPASRSKCFQLPMLRASASNTTCMHKRNTGPKRVPNESTLRIRWQVLRIKRQLGVPLTYVYPWYLLCSLGIFGDYNP